MPRIISGTNSLLALGERRPAFRVQSNNINSFGTVHGSTTYDVAYRSPLPTFPSASRDEGVNNFGMLSYASYAGGEYVKAYAPVSGLYEFYFSGALKFRGGADYVAIGLMKNTTSTSSTGNLSYYFAEYENTDTNTSEARPTNGTITENLNAGDYMTLYSQSSGNNQFVLYHVFGGKLIA